MATLLIDARYYGEMLRQTRSNIGMSASHAARLLKIPHRDLLKYEKGKLLMPEEILHKIFCHALNTLRAQYEINRKMRK